MFLIKKIIHNFILFITFKHKSKFLKYIFFSRSQLSQDIFALTVNNYKSNGFFIEFGSCDGKYFSNTFLLEKYFNWSGILAEPAKEWHNSLMKNRKVHIEKKCVWESSGDELIFSEAVDPALSYISSPSTDLVDNAKKIEYKVETISLFDLLKKYNAPNNIDFLSIDTEGSEYRILKDFDFNLYNFKVICVEHNYSNDRKLINNLLKNNNYKQVHSFLSRFDDWYIKVN